MRGASRPRPLEPVSPPEDPPTADQVIANTWREAVEPEKPKATLSDAEWLEDKTYFQEEADIQVRLTLPREVKHLTRVEAEFWAKPGPDFPDQKSPLFTGEAWADEAGTALFSIPIYKPLGYKSGAVEYYVLFKHKCAAPLSTESKPRRVERTRFKAADHLLIPGPAFPEGKSFISPRASEAIIKLAQKFKSWERKKPKKTQIAVYGHVDKGESDPKALSERRAQSAYAFITNDADTWEKLYNAEKWGLSALQELLKDLKHYKGGIDGRDTHATQLAFKAFQKKAKLRETGTEDAATRKALFLAYMQGKHDVKIDADRFISVAGHPWMGCAVNNKVKESEGSTPENRRVAFVLLRVSKYFPLHFPCQEGSETPCQAQCKRKGTRSTPGNGCMFYDELIQEETQEFCEAEPNQVAQPITYEEAQKIAFEVTASFETGGSDYGTLAGDGDKQGISFGMMQWNIGKGTLQSLLTQFETEDKSLFETCFDKNEEDLKSIRQVMAEKGTPKSNGKGLEFPAGLKWAREQVQSGNPYDPTWLGKWQEYFQKLGSQEKFKAVQRREALTQNKKPTEGKIDWLKGKNPSAWSKIPLRCYCALWDLSNQYRYTAKEIDDVERVWSGKIPDTAERMTEDFCKIVVDSRNLQPGLDKESFHKRRQGILYAGLCDADVTPGYPTPMHRQKADLLLEKEKFIQDYPG